MKVFKVTSPDGQVISVEAPEDASDAQLIELAQKKYQPKSETGANAKVSSGEQSARDLERVEILKQELGKAQKAGNAQDVAAITRELGRMGVSVPSGASVSVEPPTNADLLRQKLLNLEKSAEPVTGGPISPEVLDAVQLGATGAAALGGYMASPALGRGVQRVQEASQRPLFARPGTPPAAPLASGAPATSGEKWSANWAGQERPGVGGVPEASAAYQRSKGQGKVTGELSKRFGPAAFPPVEPGTYQGSLADRLIARNREAETVARQAASPLNRVSEMFGTIGRTGANLLSDVLRSRSMGAFGAGSVAYQGLEALKQLKAGQDEEAALSGIGALGGGLMMIPTVPTAVVGGALSAAPYLYRKAKEGAPAQGQLSDIMAP